MRIPDGLAGLVDDLGIVVAVVASVDDGAVEVLGRRSELETDDLVKQLFGDAGSVAALNRSLEGQLMPRMWSQGSVSCIVCKPDEHSIVGLLHQQEMPAVEKYRWSKAVNEQIAALWAGSG